MKPKLFLTPFALSLWFDRLTMIGKSYHPFALSLSKGIEGQQK
ncbi:MAG: hypothetical protein ACOY3V_05225 [Pseudomonadota bacterium]